MAQTLMAEADAMEKACLPPPASADDKPLPDKMNRTQAENEGAGVDPIYQDELESPETSLAGGGDDPEADDKIPGVYAEAGAFSTPQFKGNYKMQYSAAPKPGFFASPSARP